MTGLFIELGVSPHWVEALHLALLGRLLLAALLGGIIGLERELSGKPAGLRTNLLICVGAALLMELSIGLATAANDVNAVAGEAFRSDPSRIAAQIVSGIGFLGAGTIIQARGSVTGLTTAATIWVVAAIGMAVGARAYVEAIGSAVLVGLSLVLLGRVESVVIRRRRSHRYQFVIDPYGDVLGLIEQAFRKAGLRVESETIDRGEEVEVHFEVSGPHRLHEAVLRSLVSQEGIHRMSRIL